MFSPAKGFLFLPKNYQRIQFFWKFFKIDSQEPGFKNEVEKELESKPYEEILKNNPDDYVKDPLEFRGIPELTGEKRPYPRPKPSLINRIIRSPDQHDISFNGIRKKVAIFIDKKREKNQTYDAEQMEVIGADLGAAHFILNRSGSVKFVGREGFVKSGNNKASMVLPSYKDDSYKIEAINAAGIPIVYQGLQNLSELKYLRWLSLKGNPFFDNWCMDRLSMIAPNLEYLDVSQCTKLDHNAIGCFYRFKQLKCLNVEGTNDTKSFKLACLTLESEYPDLVIVGLVLKKAPKTAFTSYN